MLSVRAATDVAGIENDNVYAETRKFSPAHHCSEQAQIPGQIHTFTAIACYQSKRSDQPVGRLHSADLTNASAEPTRHSTFNDIVDRRKTLAARRRIHEAKLTFRLTARQQASCRGTHL